MKRCIETNIGIWERRARPSATSWKGLQPETPALCARLSAASGVRTQPLGPEHQGCCYAAACVMSFLRHWEIYPSDEGAIALEHALAHRLDEFPAGYSLAVCTPARPASASPTAFEYALKSPCR